MQPRAKPEKFCADIYAKRHLKKLAPLAQLISDAAVEFENGWPESAGQMPPNVFYVAQRCRALRTLIDGAARGVMPNKIGINGIRR